MDERITATGLPPAFPDHTQLPDEDGTFVKNFQEHPQSIILTDSIGPVVERLHPDGQYAIGQDCGIYWRETDPPERGAEAPDWFYVPNVPATLDGFRRSYVLWREHMAPFIALEFASGNGEEERDRTPLTVAADGTTTKPGKFWVYERIIRIPYYGIYEMRTGNLEVYHLIDFVYRRMEPNERGHYPIPVLDVELGLWQGSYQNQELLWLRWWDSQGNLLLTGSEQVEIERALVEQERERAEQAERKVTQLAERLRAMGIDPDAED
jgi:Uma2 family endonuclease